LTCPQESIQINVDNAEQVEFNNWVVQMLHEHQEQLLCLRVYISPIIFHDEIHETLTHVFNVIRNQTRVKKVGMSRKLSAALITQQAHHLSEIFLKIKMVFSLILQSHINRNDEDGRTNDIGSEQHVDRDWPSCNFRVVFHQSVKQKRIKNSEKLVNDKVTFVCLDGCSRTR
jgi:hypothetical protein